jgi:hypothetical protein
MTYNLKPKGKSYANGELRLFVPFDGENDLRATTIYLAEIYVCMYVYNASGDLELIISQLKSAVAGKRSQLNQRP